MIWTIKKVMNGFVLARQHEEEKYPFPSTRQEWIFADKETLLLHLKAAWTEIDLGPDAVKGYQEFGEDRSLD